MKLGTREQDGSLGATDPRDIKTKLEENGLTCWIDVQESGKVRVFRLSFCCTELRTYFNKQPTSYSIDIVMHHLTQGSENIYPIFSDLESNRQLTTYIFTERLI